MGPHSPRLSCYPWTEIPGMSQDQAEPSKIQVPTCLIIRPTSVAQGYKANTVSSQALQTWVLGLLMTRPASTDNSCRPTPASRVAKRHTDFFDWRLSACPATGLPQCPNACQLTSAQGQSPQTQAPGSSQCLAGPCVFRLSLPAQLYISLCGSRFQVQFHRPKNQDCLPADQTPGLSALVLQ